MTVARSPDSVLSGLDPVYCSPRQTVMGLAPFDTTGMCDCSHVYTLLVNKISAVLMKNWLVCCRLKLITTEPLDNGLAE